MADESTVENTAPDTSGEQQDQSKPDPLTNLKAEFNRKLENSNAQLLAAIESLKKNNAPPPAATKKVSELIFEDADAAAEVIEQRTEERIMKKLGQQQTLSNTMT